MLQREVNAEGASLYPDMTGSQFMGYVADGFWDTRLSGIFKAYKIVNGELLTPPLDTGIPFITTQDDLIGNAVEDVVVGQFISGANWIIKGEGNVTNGWIKLRMMDPL